MLNEKHDPNLQKEKRNQGSMSKLKKDRWK